MWPWLPKRDKYKMTSFNRATLDPTPNHAVQRAGCNTKARRSSIAPSAALRRDAREHPRHSSSRACTSLANRCASIFFGGVVARGKLCRIVSACNTPQSSSYDHVLIMFHGIKPLALCCTALRMITCSLCITV